MWGGAGQDGSTWTSRLGVGGGRGQPLWLDAIPAHFCPRMEPTAALIWAPHSQPHPLFLAGHLSQRERLTNSHDRVKDEH